MTRVLAITNNFSQASFRLRLEVLKTPLAARNIDIDIQLRPRKIRARRKLLRRAASFDSVLLQRKLLEPMDMKLLRKHAKKIFYDVDDAVMYHNRPVGALARWRTWRRFLALTRRVDLVVAGNEYLAEIFQSRGAKSTVLPTVVDVSRYEVKKHSSTSKPSLVWIGSKSTLGYLKRILPALGQASARVPGLNLIIIADASIENSPLPITHIPWSADTEVASLLRGDIGIAPTPTDRWTLGKCGFKIIQYMAAGLPVIASPVGANSQIVADNQTGFLPADPDAWVESIAKLATDQSLKSQMGQASRQRVEENYSLNRAVDFWADLLAARP